MSELLHIESSVKIHFTRDYGRFKWLKGNRQLNEAKVKKIINSIRGGVNILKYSPIIVNENMEIIDGQHRFIVAQQLKENVHYVIHKDAELSIVPTINSNSSNWKTVDFLNSYCDMKKGPYIKVRQLIESFKGLSIPVASQLMCSGDFTNKDFKSIFNEGLLEDTHFDFAKKIILILKDFEGFTHNPFSKRFAETMIQLHDNGKYSHEHMISKLNESERKIENIQSVKSIILDMESIYNHRLRSRVFIA